VRGCNAGAATIGPSEVLVNMSLGSKAGVYVDVMNMYRNGGYKMRYDTLREFACREGGDPVRLNAYATFDAERAKNDSEYRAGTANFFSALRDFGYKVLIKEVRWYEDESGKRYGKANADLDLAVDALLQSENLDRVLIASGDGDFARVVRALQNKGCRVEIVALDNVSADLRREADMFMSGYLIPNLIPVPQGQDRPAWGELGSRVRGVCYWHSDQGYGFMRFLERVGPGLWLTDARLPDSPYATAFFHDSNLPGDVPVSVLPSRNHILEFELARSSRGEGLQAVDIRLASRL
jgi:uncharacterized LabA/DUF88 family protein